MKKIDLRSTAVLEIGDVPFQDAKKVFSAYVAELAKSKIEIGPDFYKSLFCNVNDSPRLDAAIWKCMERSTYQGQKITADTFEPVEARKDYMQVYAEVLKEILSPFTSDLYAVLLDFSSAVGSFQA